MDTQLEILLDIKNILAEGPYYKDGIISFVDIVGKKLHIIDNNKIESITFNEKISAAIPIKSAGYLVFGETTIYLYKDKKIEEYLKINELMKPGMRPNDAKVDALGRIWFSTIMDDGSKPEGALYCIIDKKIILKEYTKLGNGLAFNKDNTKLYFADSALHKVFVYDYDINSGNINNKKELFEVKDGVPDGITIDSSDNLFVAIWGGSRVEVRSNIDGNLLDIIKIPTKLVTSVTFGGIDYDELIITTASIDQNDLYAGMVFKVETNYKGKSEFVFKI